MDWIDTAFIIIGILTLLAGTLFLFFPRALLKTSELANHIFDVDNQVFHYRALIGTCFLFCGMFLLLMAYYVSFGIQNQLFPSGG